MSDKNDMSYKERLARLESILKQLEDPATGLDEVPGLYDECEQHLKVINDTAIEVKKRIDAKAATP